MARGEKPGLGWLCGGQELPFRREDGRDTQFQGQGSILGSSRKPVPQKWNLEFAASTLRLTELDRVQRRVLRRSDPKKQQKCLLSTEVFHFLTKPCPEYQGYVVTLCQNTDCNTPPPPTSPSSGPPLPPRYPHYHHLLCHHHFRHLHQHRHHLRHHHVNGRTKPSHHHPLTIIINSSIITSTVTIITVTIATTPTLPPRQPPPPPLSLLAPLAWPPSVLLPPPPHWEALLTWSRDDYESEWTSLKGLHQCQLTKSFISSDLY